ncbi:MAG: helix-turn-helix domain-containing protein, partial [Actinomycetes bacterium]
MITEDSPLVGVGARVRVARKLVRDLTQQRLADRAHVSLSLIKAVEQGRVPATAGFVAAVAPVLGLTVYDLWGQPSPRYGQERAGVAALETAVMTGPALASDDRPRPLDELTAQVNEITQLRKSGRYDVISARIPDLIEDLHTAATHQTPGADAERAQLLLAIAYDDGMRCLHALGSPVAGQAAERAATAAADSGDPLLAAHRAGWGTGLAL